MLRHSELATYTANLILEEPLQRLTELQMHFLWQSANVVMALYHLTGNIQALDAVGVYRTLCKPFCSLNFLCFGIKDLNEVASDNLSLLLRICYTCQVGKEFLRCIHTYDVQSEALIVVHNIDKLVLAQHSVVHEDTSKVLANRLIEKHGSHRRVDTARQTEYNAVVTELRFQFSHGRIDERGCAPALFRATDTNYEVAQKLRTLHCMEHLRMELHTPCLLALYMISSGLHVIGAGNNFEVLRKSGDRIAMRHPNL